MDEANVLADGIEGRVDGLRSALKNCLAALMQVTTTRNPRTTHFIIDAHEAVGPSELPGRSFAPLITLLYLIHRQGSLL